MGFPRPLSSHCCAFSPFLATQTFSPASSNKLRHPLIRTPPRRICSWKARATEQQAMAKKPAVLQIFPNSAQVKEALEGKFERYALFEQKDEDAFLAEKGPSIRAVVGLGPVDEALLSKLPNLEIVSRFGVGVDNVNIPLLRSRGIALAATADVLTDSVADCALALVLATTRQVVAADKFVREGKWSKHTSFPLTVQLSGKRVGIIGLGQIGAAIAKRVESFGCTVGYWGRSAKPQYPAYTFYKTLVDLATHCDVLIAACALTEGTRKIINREVLDALGPNGFVVNIARGPVIDETELVKALVEGRIAGAGLDVFENEPSVPEELLSLDSVVLQPHLASGTIETRQAMADLCVANLEAHFAGKPLLTPV